ncbi:MAG: pseudaminic acid cytidylyltransferase [Saprospiraceae bacterium]
MKILAIIPARGGSKRVPHKNKKDFLGQPIISYSIETALQSNIFDEVMVSTDDTEIAEIALQYGANVPFLRSAKNASDQATTLDALLEVLENYKKKGIEFDYACCIYPTAPLLSTTNIQEGYSTIIKNDFKTVVTVAEYSYPIHRALQMDDKGSLSMINEKNLNARSQDLAKAYHDAGQFYWFDTNIIKDCNSLFTDQTGSIVLPESQVQDIDTEEDWIMAELKYKHLNHRYAYENSISDRRA